MNKYHFRCLIKYSILLFIIVVLCNGYTPVSGKARPHATTAAKEVNWVGTWATAPQKVERSNMPPDPGLSNNTLRQVVCVSMGGRRIRFKFSNQFGDGPVEINSIQIAESAGNSQIVASTSKFLQFNGHQSVVLNAGQEIISDPLSFNLKPRMLVAITISFAQTPSILTGHPGSRTTSFILKGNQTALEADFSSAITTDHWYFLQGIEVEAPKHSAAVAIIGDSITDGRGSGTNKQNRWPDILMLRLQDEHYANTGVLNLGIGGNCVVNGGLGPTALARFDRDILNQNGIKWLIIFEGTNDIGRTRDSAAAVAIVQKLINAYDEMISKAHAKGLKVYGATITPFKRSSYYNQFHEQGRRSVNEWIRTGGHFDGVIDFDKIIRSPVDPEEIEPSAQSDHLHPNEKGYQMMGQAIDLSIFR